VHQAGIKRLTFYGDFANSYKAKTPLPKANRSLKLRRSHKILQITDRQ